MMPSGNPSQLSRWLSPSARRTAQHHCRFVALTIVFAIVGCAESSVEFEPTPNAEPTVANANEDPTARVGEPFSHDATQAGTSFADPDGDALTYTITYDPGAFGLSDSNGMISGTPTEAGVITATITADDGNGGTVSDAFDITVGEGVTDDVATVFAGVIDIEDLDDYVGVDVPNYINEFNSGGNPVTNEGATLGRVLFYDVALSIDNTVSCSSCHAQSHGFSDPGW